MERKPVRLGWSVTILVLFCAAGSTMAQPSSDPVQALIEQERLRSVVEAAFAAAENARGSYSDPTALVEAYTDIAAELGSADPGVVPLLVNETLQADPETFFLSTYALGLQGTPEAVEGLIAAIERADGESTPFAKARKVQLVWSLASTGNILALYRADTGSQRVGDQMKHSNMKVLEAAAILTQPESIQVLHDELGVEGRPTATDDRHTLYSIRALAKIGDPSSLPVLLASLGGESTRERMEATYGLSLHPVKRSIDALFATLDDASPTVQSFAAHALLKILPRNRFDEAVAALDRMTSPVGRGAIYELLARLDGEAAVPVLAGRARTPDPKERLALYEALTLIDTAESLELLLNGLSDPDARVRITALRAIADIDQPRTRRILIRNIESPDWVTAQNASLLAAEKRLPGAADAIRGRLLRAHLPRLIRSAETRPDAEWLLDRLVELGDIKAIAGLEESREVQRDGLLIEKLDAALLRLRAVRDAGTDLERWEKMAFDGNPALRETAFRYLAHLEDEKAAAEILSSAFGWVEPNEAGRILRLLGDLDTAPSRKLVERVLTDEAYRRPELYALRNEAAWAARRLGGERLVSALEKIIEERAARDIWPILYYAQLRGAEALPLLRRVLVPRMRFDTLATGNEYVELRELIMALELGNPIDEHDTPPQPRRFM